MQNYLKKASLFEVSIIRIVFGISILTSVLILTGCGQGLAGQAIGKDTEDIRVLEEEILDISDSLANLNESFVKIEDTIDAINTSLADLAALVEQNASVKDGAQTTIVPVDDVNGIWEEALGETFTVVTADDDAVLPSTLTVEFDAGVEGNTWGDGTYVKCISESPCGHLDGPTIHGREVYFKESGVTLDLSAAWAYAYIFLKQDGANTWPIQYVIPSSQWNAHRYFDSGNPWGDWGDLTVTANYD
ncbi:MAG: hypothetical protein OSB07_09945 [Dehalococcoidia bacterium]|nr:hypothetical protein [Dehalococcoidia bacterium]